MAASLDDLDQQIIGLLRTDARRTNTDLAKHLGVSEGTVRNRIRRLISEGYMLVVAMTRLHKLGYTEDVLVAVSTEAGKEMQVAEALSRLPATRYVALTTGGYDIMVGAVFKNHDELLKFLIEDVPAIQGVVRTATSHVLKTLKRTHDWVIFEEDDEPTSAEGAVPTGTATGAAP